MSAIRINLLPHREERRKRSRTHFAVLGAMTFVLGLVIVGAVHIVNAQRISAQDDRNTFLKGEIAKLDKQIADIKKLKDEIQSLLARKQVIETLQADRAQTVHLLDQLVRQMPEGVYLKSIKQKGLAVNLVGYAQSNARVSTLMRNIESSPWLEKPELVEIKATTVNKQRVSEFNLNLSLKRLKPEEDKRGTPGAKVPVKKG
ncbi:MAG TPA: PilN domain-containing protein [Burkholderiales bacterium]|nr:PilN domain-containing protein [Burkholderiales bacterium]